MLPSSAMRTKYRKLLRSKMPPRVSVRLAMPNQYISIAPTGALIIHRIAKSTVDLVTTRLAEDLSPNDKV